MEYKNIIEKFKKFNKEKQKIFCIFIIEDLIIGGRSTYNENSINVDDPIKLRHFNELKHQVMNKLTNLIYSSSEFTVEDFFKIIIAYDEKVEIKISFNHIFKSMESLEGYNTPPTATT